MKLTLKEPVVVGDTTVTELNVRDRVVAGDLRGIPMRNPMLTDDLLKLAGRLCGQPDHVMNALSLEDFERLAGVVVGFSNGGQKAQTERSPS